ncbi:TadE family type IV pilus minor pilin [Micrococcus sp.]|uniref:TadE family type IV pilus minor pilin n=1 Tax=Micrococcus sp. TaxID=1271 RepID=UPI002A909C8F|nr:TadE family type IV pilus minor pilin [Micrococcus sp.]MDY6055299.1 TadE family type IV pilus minor pilin [Micrococcus sp.]
MTDTGHGKFRPGRPRGGRAGAVGQAWARARHGETGAVTAEYAVLLPAVVFMLVAVLLAGVASVQQVRHQDAAAAAARILARGDGTEAAREAVSRMAGSAARMEERTEGGWVTVTVRRPAPGLLEPLTLRASASAPVQAPPWRVRS